MAEVVASIKACLDATYTFNSLNTISLILFTPNAIAADYMVTDEDRELSGNTFTIAAFYAVVLHSNAFYILTNSI